MDLASRVTKMERSLGMDDGICRCQYSGVGVIY
jgi:hypothetical protein